MHVVLLAHGSRDPRHAATVDAMAAAVAVAMRRDQAGVSSAYLDLTAPDLPSAVADGDDVVVVPLLLSSAFHASVDVPAAVDALHTARPGVQVRVTAPLGLPASLVRALDERAREADADLRDPALGTVLLAAGTSDPHARQELQRFAAAAFAGDDRMGRLAFAAGEPGATETIGALADEGATTILISPLMLAPGVLLDRAHRTARAAADARGIALVLGEPIGAHPAVVDLIVQRIGTVGS